MTDEFKSRSGPQLYRLLPAIYRVRDGSETGDRLDLTRYLDAFGVLLDGLRALLDQQLADAFPDDAPSPLPGASGRLTQDWVLPYLGALVDARPVSIDPRGQRAEVASAVRWRQRKGTMKAAEELTEAVALVSAVLQEGWQRIAVTARIDGRRNRPVTVDTRLVGRAVVTDIDAQGADFTCFEGIELPWRVVDPGGVPATPHSYQDASLRTVDTRAPSPDRLRGLYHPRRLLAWVAPQETLFPLRVQTLRWQDFVADNQRLRLQTDNDQEFVSAYRGVVEIEIPAGTTLELAADQPYYLEGLRFTGPVVVPHARLVARECHFQALELRAPALDEPVLAAESCLFTAIAAGAGAVDLAACTVRGPLVCRTLVARHSIFTGSVGADAKDVEPPPRADAGAVRFLVDDPNHRAAAVLHPDNPPEVCANGGAELGRYRRGRRFPVTVDDDVDLSTSPSATREYPLCDLVFAGTADVTTGAVWLRRVAVRTLNLPGPAEVHATGCIFAAVMREVKPTADEPPTPIEPSPPPILELEYCTLMRLAVAVELRISDCIVVAAPTAPTARSRLRWSSLPADWPLADHERCVHAVPCFLANDFGDRLHGLLSPASAAAIRSGAEDGGELGAYHDAYWLQRLVGVEEKLREHVPIGITPMLIPDPTLVRIPPPDATRVRQR